MKGPFREPKELLKIKNVRREKKNLIGLGDKAESIAKPQKDGKWEKK